MLARALGAVGRRGASLLAAAAGPRPPHAPHAPTRSLPPPRPPPFGVRCRAGGPAAGAVGRGAAQVSPRGRAGGRGFGARDSDSRGPEPKPGRRPSSRGPPPDKDAPRPPVARRAAPPRPPAPRRPPPPTEPAEPASPHGEWSEDGDAPGRDGRGPGGEPVAQPQGERGGRGEGGEGGEGGESGEGGGAAVAIPRGRNAKVTTAEFVTSSVRVGDCPPATLPEIALIGRSNVGKSSLLNLLAGRTGLAMVSKTPGKTRCINHFVINGSWYLVDLPGYGYVATAGKAEKRTWTDFTRDYFRNRDSLITVLLLVDASIPPLQMDLDSAAWLSAEGVPVTVVYTKVDKRKKLSKAPPPEANMAAFDEALAESWEELPPRFPTSARTGAGKAALLSHLAGLRELLWEKRKKGRAAAGGEDSGSDAADSDSGTHSPETP